MATAALAEDVFSEEEEMKLTKTQKEAVLRAVDNAHEALMERQRLLVQDEQAKLLPETLDAIIAALAAERRALSGALLKLMNIEEEE